MTHLRTDRHVQWNNVKYFDNLRSLGMEQQIMIDTLLAQWQTIPLQGVHSFIDLVGLTGKSEEESFKKSEYMLRRHDRTEYSTIVPSMQYGNI